MWIKENITRIGVCSLDPKHRCFSLGMSLVLKRFVEEVLIIIMNELYPFLYV